MILAGLGVLAMLIAVGALLYRAGYEAGVASTEERWRSIVTKAEAARLREGKV